MNDLLSGLLTVVRYEQRSLAVSLCVYDLTTSSSSGFESSDLLTNVGPLVVCRCLCIYVCMYLYSGQKMAQVTKKHKVP